MMLRTLIALILSAVVALPHGGALADEEPFPGYDESCGFEIVIRPTRSVSQAIVTFQGDALVILDPVLEERTESIRRIFLIAHECAHHVLGHTTGTALEQRGRSARIIRDHEMSADCWAAEYLTRVGVERPVQVMANRFHRAGLYSPGGGYPSGIQRSTIIRHCAERELQRRAEAASSRSK